ncbi:hypothetical protein A2761_01945 [Candidatus Kaiserbacteria bacterium RIFCSPHIGHO2_01_FULL_51_33]|uniref:Uncharacterized protein n=1 Tax=Candidatus Kaiserbacteria bacterium RIFCSPLOWO2_01_FULL_51_21 TaxID=1798508 RepID=A0A1F6EEC0_9BACT|nr:MAG: hypothetical protein A2761_01945 [Candidatus Kaiserbacteria bacterium RIFCSPHIGHO2_01_FULL_51_33]OGG71562.1 MAG: hypothetical protein A3A35_00245 [Candidatus Kaiserbacteria bacterium RIFCSPLOWO2_01_FULL_51_21]
MQNPGWEYEEPPASFFCCPQKKLTRRLKNQEFNPALAGFEVTSGKWLSPRARAAKFGRYLR